MKYIMFCSLLFATVSFGAEESYSIGKAIVDSRLSAVQDYLEHNELAADELERLIALAHVTVKQRETEYSSIHTKPWYTLNIAALGATAIACFFSAKIFYVNHRKQMVDALIYAPMPDKDFFLKHQTLCSPKKPTIINSLGIKTIALTMLGIGCAAATYYLLKQQDEELASRYHNATAIESLLRLYSIEQK